MPANKIANRPVVLTIAMWVLLALSIGAAGLLVHLKSGLWRIALTDPQTVGSVEMRLPVGWDVDYRRYGGSEFINAVESGPPGRKLTVRVTSLDEQLGPMDFLLNSDLVRLMTLEREDVQTVEDIEVPGGSGSIIHPKRGPSLAILTFEDGRAVTIQLASGKGSSGSDDAIIYHVATSLRLHDPPSIEVEPEIEVEPAPRRRWVPGRGREI